MENRVTGFTAIEDAVQQVLTVLKSMVVLFLPMLSVLGNRLRKLAGAERNGRGIIIRPPALIGDGQTKRPDGKYLNDFDFTIGKFILWANLTKYRDTLSFMEMILIL